jgi:hypothetical protein
MPPTPVTLFNLPFISNWLIAAVFSGCFLMEDSQRKPRENEINSPPIKNTVFFILLYVYFFIIAAVILAPAA